MINFIKGAIKTIIFIGAICIGIISIPIAIPMHIIRSIKEKKHARSLLPQQLLADLDDFIDNHYEFNVNPKYKGFGGRLSADSDKYQAELSGKRELEKPGRYVKLVDRFNLYVEHYKHPRFAEPESEEAHRKAFDEHVRKVREELGEKLDDSFSVALMEILNTKGKAPSEVYKRANIDRRLFSKIRKDYYIPGKRTAIALAVALELSLEETKELIARAGFTLSRSLLFDVIIEYFIAHGKYDIYEINEMLFAYKQPILGE